MSRSPSKGTRAMTICAIPDLWISGIPIAASANRLFQPVPVAKLAPSNTTPRAGIFCTLRRFFHRSRYAIKRVRIMRCRLAVFRSSRLLWFEQLVHRRLRAPANRISVALVGDHHGIYECRRQYTPTSSGLPSIERIASLGVGIPQFEFFHIVDRPCSCHMCGVSLVLPRPARC